MSSGALRLDAFVTEIPANSDLPIRPLCRLLLEYARVMSPDRETLNFEL